MALSIETGITSKFLLEEYRERISHSYHVLALIGNPGTGTTELGKGIAESHNARFLSIGDWVKSTYALNDSERTTGYERRAERDREIDNHIESIILNAPTEGNIVLDSRMSAWIYRDIQDHSKPRDKSLPKVITIYVDADENVAAQRVANRQGISVEEAMSKNSARREKDLASFKLAYPDIQLGNLIDPDALYTNGKRLYDLVIHNSTMSVGKEIRRINKLLLETNLQR